MSKKPLLIFPSPGKASRTNQPPGRGNLNIPKKELQITYHEQKLSELDRVLSNKTAELSQFIGNVVPEMILVLETAGEIDAFFKAVRETPGMDFLAEYESEVDADDDFFIKDKLGNKTDKPVDTRFYLTMTNQRALRELQRYWNEYKKEGDQQKFKRGTTKFRKIFEQLKDIRAYSIEDRIRDTGLEEYIKDMKEHEIDHVRFEIELAFREEKNRNETAYYEVLQLLGIHGGYGILGSRTIIPQIGYHAFIASAPVTVFDDLTDNTDVLFLKSQQILFFRPVGQVIMGTPDAPQNLIAPEKEIEKISIPIDREPLVALLDGMPLENHQLLQNRLIIDDPDGFTVNYLSSLRYHGTSMASLIAHGDLGNPNYKSLDSPIYVRPIMKPSPISNIQGEALPDDKLPLDLIHRAIIRMKFGENGEAPTAPDVKFINLSIGDPFRPFHFNMSTWAKLLDWLSIEFDILFIVSAGNYWEDLVLEIDATTFDTLNPEQMEKLVLEEIVRTNYNRKILTPSESINSLTVGATHNDASTLENLHQRKNIIDSPHLPSPISRIGFGFRKSIKPEILMDGGRKLYRKAPLQSVPSQTRLRMESFQLHGQPPGNKVALPSSQGVINGTGYVCGTSNSAALTSRLAVQLYDVLSTLTLDDGTSLDREYYTVLIKSLLVHSAGWGKGSDKLLDIVKALPGVSPKTVKRNVLPYLGYGHIDPERILFCTDHRVTLLGYGVLSNKNAHVYTFPLPPGISQQTLKKRLTITLGYHSPLNFSTRKYRKAHLYFDNLKHNAHLDLNRNYFDFRKAQSGTIQHDILEGDKADAFVDGDNLIIKINCREDASGLGNQTLIKYGLSVTLEVAEDGNIPIYEEIRQRLQTRIRPRV